MDLKSVYKKTKILWKKIRNVNVFVGRIKKNGFSEMNLKYILKSITLRYICSIGKGFGLYDVLFNVGNEVIKVINYFKILYINA